MDTVRHLGLRSRAARLAAAAHSLKRRSGAAPPFCLAFLTDQARAPHPELIARSLPENSALIFRDYRMPGRAHLAARLKSICAARGVKLLIGADMALAEKIGADGVHFPRWHAPGADFPKHLILTAACHDADALTRAGAMGADAALLSPAFATQSHPGAIAAGPARLRMLAAGSPIPVLALGGVNAGNAHLLAGPNIAGIAAISAFLR